ncbi:flagellar hook-length control protein FliK [Dechloromonas sp. A34]|uniref:flagellar hook-length control protein FliK n=1 Tax=Dechloromonas sp. A34 TaxID=447588 RepID=UPI0022490B70|nr:flagellar hook-length control protein FliK [Dechloromonas sp. A34]
MLPPDVASSLRLVLPDQQAATNAQTQPVASSQKIADVLSNLVPGQRILAEIQALLPNGSYRAVVAQRDVTLALPFSAKAGDTLELEVTESDGKLTLAFVANRSDNTAKPGQESVATTLSPTGKMIGDLMGGIDGEGKRAPPAPLNGSQPLVESMPKTAADLAPILKQALTQSGMFYEAHQARWVAGELPTDALKNEPQGKLSTLQTQVTGDAASAKSSGAANADALAINPAAAARSEAASGNPVPRELAPLVHQQLDGLATQNFAWQGQVWPGQQMRWEIGEDLDNSPSSGDQEAQRWQTRLKLSLPLLGDIDVALNLRAGGEVSITLTADSDTSEASLRDGAQQLRRQFDAAGLNLTNLVVQHGEAAE